MKRIICGVPEKCSSCGQAFSNDNGTPRKGFRADWSGITCDCGKRMPWVVVKEEDVDDALGADYVKASVE